MAELFEKKRTHLLAVAFRVLGLLSEAEDAVQEVWLRLSHADASAIKNVVGWLTTVVARVCLDMLRSRKSRRAELVSVNVTEPTLSSKDRTHPEYEALLADGDPILYVSRQLGHSSAKLTLDTYGHLVEEGASA